MDILRENVRGTDREDLTVESSELEHDEAGRKEKRSGFMVDLNDFQTRKNNESQRQKTPMETKHNIPYGSSTQLMMSVITRQTCSFMVQQIQKGGKEVEFIRHH